MSPSFSVGMLTGTFLGGELAHPYGRLPSLFGGTNKFWVKHPYALPCIIVGGIDLITVLVGIFLLVETRPPTKSSLGQTNEKNQSKNQFKAAFKVPTFMLLNVVFLLFQVSTFSWDGMYTVYTYTPPSNGGLGLGVDTIGLLYSANYLVSFLANPIFLPRMQKRWGATKSLGIILSMWPVLSLLIPLTQWTAVHARWMMWGVLLVQLTLRAVGAFGWAMCDILILGCFDDYPELMATGSAISLIGGAGGRAFGPAISGWLFSIATQYPTGTLLRQVSWVYMVGVTVPAVLLVRFLPREKVRGGKEEYEAVPMLEADERGQGERVRNSGTSI